MDRKIFTLLVILTLSYASFAQTPPNGDCEYYMQFDNSSQTINSYYSFNLDGEYTVTGWFKTGPGKQYITSISRDNYSDEVLGVYLNEDGNLKVEHKPILSFDDVTLTSSTTLNDNSWHHYAVVKETDSLKLYINGVLDQKAEFEDGFSENIDFEVTLGSSSEMIWETYAGGLDEFTIWQKALSVTEINNYKDNQLDGSEANLVLNYDFNEQQGEADVLDKSPNKINANFSIFSDLSRELVDGGTCNFFEVFPPNDGCGTVLDFDGSDDHIQTNIPASTFYESDFTVEAWIYIRSFSSSFASMIMSNRKDNEGVLFYVTGDSFGADKSRLCLQLGSSDIFTSTHIGNTILETDRWYHVAASYKFNGTHENEVKLYVNGEEDGSFNDASNILTGHVNAVAAEELFIGFEKRPSAPQAYHFNGMLDEIRVWSDVRNGTEINTNQNISFDANQEDLVAAFNCNEAGQSSGIYDLNDFNNPDLNYEGVLTNMDPASDWVQSDGLQTSNSTFTSISANSCGSYLSPNGLSITKSGKYIDVLVNSYGCDSTILINAQIDNNPNNTVGVNGYELISNSYGSDLQYEWTSCDEPSLGVLGSERTYEYSSSGSYKVKITNGTCVVESDCKSVSVATSIAENGLPNILSKVYPSPTSGDITLELKKQSKVIQLNVYSIDGALTQNETFNNTDQINFFLEGEPGLYFIEMKTSDNQHTSFKVVKK